MATLHGLKFQYLLLTAAVSTLCVPGAHAQDPPARVADLNYLSGNVSMQPAGADDWSPAVMNRPFTTGDYLWADSGARAELHLDDAVLRLGPETSMGFLNLDDQIAQIRFAQGEFILRVRQIGDGETFEVDTPNAAITILREGEYRFNAYPDSATTEVVVREGQAEVTGGGQAFTLEAGNSAQLSGTDQLAYNVEYAPAPDWFESWSQDRDAHEARLASARYLPPDVIGYEELDNNGVWRETPDYGAVWYPSVGVGWAPYRYGHWAWIEPWGWTWVDDEPWGFAPFHYGRWAFIGGAWGWIPGPVAIVGGRRPYGRPVYAPALVAFIGGNNWGVSLSIGGPAVGWVPLGPGEVYVPAYHVSPNYFRTVNVHNTTVVNNVNITNVYNTVYVNRTPAVPVNQRYANMVAPNAVTAMPQNAFASGRPARQVGVSVPGTQVAELRSVPVAVAPPVAPARQALAPQGGSMPARRPPARVISRPVVAKVAPPAPPVPFAAKQEALRQYAGRPVNTQAIRQSVGPGAVATPLVRVAPAARPVAAPVRPSMPARTAPNPTPAYNERPSQPAPRVETPARPAPTYRPPAYNERPSQPAPRVETPARPAPTYRPPAYSERPSQPAPRVQPRTQPAPPEKASPSRKPEERPKPERKDKDKQ